MFQNVSECISMSVSVFDGIRVFDGADGWALGASGVRSHGM